MGDTERRPRLVASALCVDEAGAILLVQPTYRAHWLMPGGRVEAGESPHAGCLREVQEELGLSLPCPRLLCVDYRAGGETQHEAIHFVFAGGILFPVQIDRITLPPDELRAFAFFPLAEAMSLLPPKGGLRLPHVIAAWERGQPAYLEEGMPLLPFTNPDRAGAG